MHVISPLAAGIVGADNGLARIYRRGTSTRATVYTDFEASTADSSGADIALDSTGGAVIYVNELVQVQVFSSLGQLIRDFISGDGAYAVEVISPAFTGTDYTSGARGASKPTTAGAIFDLWLTSAGAIDWKVLFSGAATDLQDALGSIYGLFFNVKSPEFGALGNGSADDTASWQAAHDAAAAVGGIVVAPPGIYNLSSAISWKTGVHLFCMPDSVMLRQTTAAASIIAITGSIVNATITAGTPTYFIGCVLDSTVTNSATQFTIGHANLDEVIVDSFRFNASDFCTGAGLVIGSTTGRVQVRNSEFTARASTILLYNTTSGAVTNRLWVDNCDFTSWAGAYGQPMIKSADNELRVTRSRFFFQSTSLTTIGIYLEDATYPLIVSDCYFHTTVSGDVEYAVQLFTGGRYFIDESNYFSPGVDPYYQAAVADVASEGLSALALRKESTGTTTGVTHTVPDFVESFFLLSTNVAATQVTLPKIFYYGQPLLLAIKCGNAADWAATSPTLIAPAGLAVAYDNAPPNLTNGRIATVTLVALNVSGTKTWVQFGSWGDVA